MLASPIISLKQQMQAELTRPSTRSSSRILCLRLQKGETSKGVRTHSWSAIAESFLRFSPRVQFRVEKPSKAEIVMGKLSLRTRAASETSYSSATVEGTTAWFFLDIASTAHLFAADSSNRNGEAEVMQQCMSLARDLSLGVPSVAVADTPAGAQAFATSHPSFICPSGEERERLKDLSLPFLLQLEGLEKWDKTSSVESVVTFFLMLGFKRIGEIARFPFASFQERWGETGALLWRRIHGEDSQAVSPLLPSEPLEDYAHLDFPVSLVSILLHRVEKSFDFLFSRLEGRRLFARKLIVILHCEYSQTQHKIEIEPNVPCRDRELFTTLLENKLSDLDLENPIRDFEVKVDACPEKSRQLDFFEPRTTDRDKLQTLFSLLSQSALKPGLYEIEPAVMPEQTWRLRTEELPSVVAAKPVTPLQLAWEALALPAKLTQSSSLVAEKSQAYGEQSSSYTSNQDPQNALTYPQRELGFIQEESLSEPLSEHERAIAPTPSYGENVMMAPRPTRLLVRPRPVAIEELQRLKFLSTTPIERLEDGWWKDSRGEARAGPAGRDYFFAVSPEGQCLWIFQDHSTGEHFLHGYFD